jgi:hypothetical protein
MLASQSHSARQYRNEQTIRMKSIGHHDDAYASSGDADAECILHKLAYTTSGPYLRPFTRNASWRTARVFIVGTNPATPLRDEFDSFEAYWLALSCNPSDFEKVYLSQRTGKPSKTTMRIKRFESHLADVGVLRTNSWQIGLPCLPAPPPSRPQPAWTVACASSQILARQSPRAQRCIGLLD